MVAGRWVAPAWLGLVISLCVGCTGSAEPASREARFDQTRVIEEVEAALWAFHAADTARNAEGVIGLLWPDYSMLGDGARLRYADVAAGSRDFMAGLSEFHTEWSDLEIIPLGPDAAVTSFLFRDSILSEAGDLIRSTGPTTLVWERREGVWRVRFGDADHYPIDP